MSININLKEKISGFPEDIKEIAELILESIEKGDTKTKIVGMIKDEIREIVIEEENV